MSVFLAIAAYVIGASIAVPQPKSQWKESPPPEAPSVVVRADAQNSIPTVINSETQLFSCAFLEQPMLCPRQTILVRNPTKNKVDLVFGCGSDRDSPSVRVAPESVTSVQITSNFPGSMACYLDKWTIVKEKAKK